MSKAPAQIVDSRHDIVLLFDCQDGNPNGDPDGDNAPRVDPISRHGLVTDVCIKRKLRNYVQQAKSGKPPFAIYITDGAVLADKKRDAYASLDIQVQMIEESEEGAPRRVRREPRVRRGGENIAKVRQFMVDHYWDIRTFGAVMNTNVPAGTVRGPVQFTFGRSITPIDPTLWTITRMAVETHEEQVKQAGDARTMGRKYTVPYALYCAHGFITPGDAAKTGFNASDLQLLRQGLRMMFETDHAAGRGLMTVRGIYVFKHDNALGHEQAGRLFERVKVTPKAEAPMSFKDFQVQVDGKQLPDGVALEDWLN
jgi:CRISPR-associated protein Csd2